MTEAITITPPGDDDFAPINNQVDAARAYAERYVCADQASYEKGAAFLRGFTKPAKAAVLARLAPVIDQLNKAHKSMTGMRAEMLAPIQEIDLSVRRKLEAYAAEQARAKAEEERRIATAARIEEAARVAAALEGKAVEAQKAPVTQPLPTAVPPKAEGLTMIDTLTVSIDDKGALLAMLATRPDLHYLVDVSESKLAKLIKQQDGTVEYPGITVTHGKSSRMRG